MILGLYKKHQGPLWKTDYRCYTLQFEGPMDVQTFVTGRAPVQVRGPKLSG